MMLTNIIKELKNYPSEFRFNKQNNTEIEKFFKEELKCEFIPKDVLEFYKEFDGCELSWHEIFTIEDIKREYRDIDEFLEFMEIDKKENKYIPIANDGMGGLYVFISNSEDNGIYYLDHEYPDEQVRFESFSEYLEEEYKIVMEMLEEE